MVVLLEQDGVGMIVVNGREYKTLSDEFFVNGKKVYEAYVNGELVYPEASDIDPYHIWVIAKGKVDTSLPPSEYIDYRDQFNDLTAGVTASVTSVMRFDDMQFELESKSSYPTYHYLRFSTKNQDALYVIPECWNIINLDFSDASRFELELTYKDYFVGTSDYVVTREDVVSRGVLNRFSDTYKFKRVSRTGVYTQTGKKYFSDFGMSNQSLLKFGDVGMTGSYYSAQIEDIDALTVDFNNFKTSYRDGNPDVHIYEVNKNNTHIYDKTILDAYLLPIGIKARQAYISTFTYVDSLVKAHYGFEEGQQRQGFVDRIFSVIPTDVKVIMPGESVPYEYLELANE
jgi:hypothetical protein